MRDDARVDSVVADWMERRERGEAIEPGEVIRSHPDLAADLQERFAALQLVDLAFAEAPRPRDVPERIGPFRIAELLGTGGMGSVYRATLAEASCRLPEGQQVALKVIHPHLLQGAGFFKRFLREAELGRRVEHENVVRTLDVDAREQDGRPFHYLVMEYVEGQTLRDLLDEIGRVPEDLCRHVGLEVSRGLAAIHGAGVVHRDLKPENVLLTRDHVVKVMDLGVARRADDTRLSQAGAFVGSLSYAAPEQVNDPEHVDARADLHALGVLLYELATGSNPFDAGDARAVLRKVLDAAPRRCSELNPQLSPFLEEVVHTLLAKRREERFGSATEVARVLEEGERCEWWRDRARVLRVTTRRPLRRVRIPRETALHGRETEIARLRDLWARAKSGEGNVLLVEGEAGIGKSRLVDEFAGLLQAEGEDLNFLFGSYPPGGAATASGAFTTAYREHFGEAGCAPWLTQTPLLVPAFDALLRGDAAPPGAEPLTKDSLQTVFVHATRNLAAERPTIVLVEDLHFAPEEGRALFASLALAVPGHRVLLVGTMRPGVPDTWRAQLERLGHTERMDLPRLGAKDLVLMLRDAFRSERLAEELGARVALKSDGNPFFVFEILRGLREGQFLRQRPDGTWETTQVLRDLTVPSSILDLVNARVADLDEEDRDLLDVAACLGFEFDATLVAEALGLARIPALKRFAQVERRHRLVRAAGHRFVFDHHQVQEALYAALPAQLAQEYHAALGEALERREGAAEKDPKSLDGPLCVAIARHFLRGAQPVRARRYVVRALAHLDSRYLHEESASLAECALAAPDVLPPRERLEVLLRLESRLEILGRRERQREALADALGLADREGDPRLRGEVRNLFGRWHTSVGRAPEALRILESARDLARTAGDPRLESSVELNLGSALLVLSRHDAALERFEAAARLSHAAGDSRGEAAAVGNSGIVARRVGRLDVAEERFGRCLSLARASGYRRAEAAALQNLGLVSEQLDRIPEAAERTAAGRTLSRSIGDRASEGGATVNLGQVLFLAGRLPEARAELEAGLRIARETGHVLFEANAESGLGLVLGGLGETAAAREHHTHHLGISRRIGDRQGEATAAGNLGELLREEERDAEARPWFELQAAIGREVRDPESEAFGLLGLGRLAARGGDPDTAHARLAEALRLCRGAGLRRAESLVLEAMEEASLRPSAE